MRVALVVASSGEGGLENHVVSLTNALAGVQDLEVGLVAPESFSARIDPSVAFMPVELTGSRRNPFLLRRLRRTLCDFNPDIIHAHANKAAAMVASVRKSLPARCVATVHGTKKNLDVFKKYDHVIAVSQSIAKSISGVPVSVIYNGVDCRVDSSDVINIRKQLGISDSRYVFVAIGRLAYVKRFDVLINAMVNLDADLVLIGDGPERSTLEAQVNDLGLSKQVHFVGFLPSAASYLKQFDTLVISSDREGFPYVFSEALTRKVPVVSTDVSDIKKILGDDYVVPPSDAESLSTLMLKVLSDRNMSLYSKAFDFASEELTFEAMVNRTYSLYRKMLS